MKEKFLSQFVNKEKVAELNKKRQMKQQRKRDDQTLNELITATCMGRKKLDIRSDTYLDAHA